MKLVTSGTHSPAQELALFGLIIVCVGLVELVGLTRPLRAGLEVLFKPMLMVSTRFSQIIQLPYTVARAAYNSSRRIQDLEFRYAEVSAQLGELTALKEENQALRQILENPNKPAESMILTTPLVSLAYPSLAAGSLEGIQPGQMVLVANTLIGVVGSVTEHQAEVLLLSQPTHQPVLAKTESGIQGLVKGDGRRVLLTELPLDAPIQVGERVVTLGQTGIKRDTYVGRVSSIESQPSSSVQTVVIEQLVSFYQARIVEVR